MTVEFATFGSIGIDDIVFPDGKTMWLIPGGGSMYSGLGMAIWGVRPSVVAPVGPGYPLEQLETHLDFSHMPRLDRTMRNWGLYEEDGKRHFVLRSTTRDYRTFCATPASMGSETFRHVHISAMPWDMQRDMARALRARGTEVLSIDGDDQTAHEMTRTDIADLASNADLFVPSKQDVQSMMPNLDAIDCLKCLRDIAPDVPVIVVKLGEDGVAMHARNSNDLVLVPTAAEQVIDVTGAGDAFSGGTLKGYADTRDPIEAVMRGAVSASFAIAAHGPAALLLATKHEMLRRLERLRSRIELKPI
ncbi:MULTISPECIES: carbohydrate kinase family protein [Mesorhizobium]|uniref:Sugar or nucleoside kinase, ribokinase family n=1 Tax=Mesorhizobium qingshengii TaxID=1165689 RepID=A0A1G5ZWL5_9HYPH|nr:MULTISPECIES: carbohydrate kinase family protein [Mesorhizobium]AID34983.1 carbohydrate kinase [Mesorhizobium huakuii 7653R]MCH4560644.1 carbohydrate kinase family protein [Mesorhizobium jarvisii]SDA99085.1 Sugar or nucleoside kinase, ribokinase family [Mesorhizobium qingshengii]